MEIKTKIHRFTLAILTIVFIGISTVKAYTIVGLTNFEKCQTYEEATFSDIYSGDWYYSNIVSVYEYGLMSGNGNGTFAPSSNLSIAEAIAISTRIHHTYFFGYSYSYDPTDPGEFWYSPYVSYALNQGLTSSAYPDYNAPITRAEFAKIISGSVDPIDLEEINTIDDGAIPDVPSDTEYADGVYLLYRAGVLTGADSNGSFNPDATITRAEAAAVITRIIDPSLRQSLDLGGEY